MVGIATAYKQRGADRRQEIARGMIGNNLDEVLMIHAIRRATGPGLSEATSSIKGAECI